MFRLAMLERFTPPIILGLKKGGLVDSTSDEGLP